MELPTETERWREWQANGYGSKRREYPPEPDNSVKHIARRESTSLRLRLPDTGIRFRDADHFNQNDA